jgi:hypothetical protein
MSIPLLPKGFHEVHGDRGAVRCTPTASLGDAPVDELSAFADHRF